MFSKISCKIQGHEWQGCKCSRCGKARDEHHNFQPIEGKCEQQCTVCEKTEKLPHQWDGYICSRCGTVRRFTDRFLPFLHLEHKKNKTLLGVSLFLIVMFIFVGIMAALEEKPTDDIVNTTETAVVEQNVPETSVADTSTEEPIITNEPTEANISEEVTPVSENPATSISPSIDETPTPDTDNSRTVYVTKTGKKYHDSSNCNGADYTPTTLNKAISIGLKPCEKCVN